MFTIRGKLNTKSAVAQIQPIELLRHFRYFR